MVVVDTHLKWLEVISMSSITTEKTTATVRAHLYHMHTPALSIQQASIYLTFTITCTSDIQYNYSYLTVCLIQESEAHSSSAISPYH